MRLTLACPNYHTLYLGYYAHAIISLNGKETCLTKSVRINPSLRYLQTCQKQKKNYTFVPLLLIRGDFNVPPVVQLSFFINKLAYKQLILAVYNSQGLFQDFMGKGVLEYQWHEQASIIRRCKPTFCHI